MLLPLSFTKFAFKFARIMKNEPTYSLLNAINYPKDLRQLSVDQLPEVCEELRQDIIKELSCNPGHFAASLGVVELTVALHYVYNTPYDRIVWDVGHQAYAHKILTGRREGMAKLRQLGGISGFPKRSESEYDAFGLEKGGKAPGNRQRQRLLHFAAGGCAFQKSSQDRFDESLQLRPRDQQARAQARAASLGSG